ncbi:hypothetical protein C7256_27635 [Enterocloster lavalensis]|nr:hypothetical protein C7256_27635 [Enterocloster lavalensis]
MQKAYPLISRTRCGLRGRQNGKPPFPRNQISCAAPRITHPSRLSDNINFKLINVENIELYIHS